MNARSPSIAPDAAAHPLLEAGMLFGMVSSVAYTAANVVLRDVALSFDPVWISCIKAIPTAALTSLIVAHRAWRGERIWPERRLLAYIVLSGLFAQLFGNVLFQWSLSVVGLALTVPLCFGTLITSGAWMGRVLLREPITPRSLLAMGLLIAAIAVLGSGASEAGASIEQVEPREVPLAHVAAGVAAACASGVAYALSAVVLRGVAHRVPLAVTLWLVSSTGFLSLGAASLVHVGLAQLATTGWGSFAWMLVAGVCNTIGFYTLGRSLQHITVVKSNALSASQAAMAALCGVVLFREACDGSLLAGIALTVVGLLAIEGRPRPGAEAQSPVPPAD